ncbi:4'-phosphopantetheinyl transferase family protein [Robbsia andropogonis]|uniref:4'-phosphopantetheinyl transferase family protein n=1 Tax=Robbsia andropogonis TaxID=28092 RepID=UPI000465041C|nr:4'-phosphopantetheinyl transferase superfamily protein [Robbsia andropogonis]MCP1119383.1 4'-phosphopantetheinyl transferase superfamily protein [Robbsia andropogonis]MCP1129224.1 4'-phosphopantetheinyl transferase superfamily protein [Robbsia andropogonis]
MIEHAMQLDAAGRWPADVTIWCVAMPPPDAALDDGMLTASERARAAAYHQAVDRTRFVVARGTLRALLGSRLGIKAGDVRLHVGMHGRLALCDSENRLSFNVSHSGGYALIAMSDARQVGIDVEWCDPALDWRSLVDLVCTQQERSVLCSPAKSAAWQRERFFQCWTAKEALLKTLGVGITGGLQGLTLDLADGRASRRVVQATHQLAGACDLRYCWFSDIPTYMGCIAFTSEADVSV